MTIVEYVDNALRKQNKKIFSRKEIINICCNEYNLKPTSVIPSDYCYNKTNNGISFSSSTRILIQTENGEYQYVGKNFRYSGPVYNKGIIIGHWADGCFHLSTEENHIKTTQNQDKGVKKYELNLKREFPRIPFYDDFWKWAGWGKRLMDLHINFEEAEPFPLEQIEFELKNEINKTKLKADKELGIITLDTQTALKGFPDLS